MESSIVYVIFELVYELFLCLNAKVNELVCFDSDHARFILAAASMFVYHCS